MKKIFSTDSFRCLVERKIKKRAALSAYLDFARTNKGQQIRDSFLHAGRNSCRCRMELHTYEQLLVGTYFNFARTDSFDNSLSTFICEKWIVFQPYICPCNPCLRFLYAIE